MPLLSTPSVTPEFHFQKHKNKKQTAASQHRRRSACRYNCFTRCGTDRKHQCETPIKKFCSTPMRDTDQNFLSDSVLRCTHQYEARVIFLMSNSAPRCNTIASHGSKFHVTSRQHYFQPRIKISCPIRHSAATSLPTTDQKILPRL